MVNVCGGLLWQGGAYLLLIMDESVLGWGLLMLALVETVAIVWIYGMITVTLFRCFFKRPSPDL